MRIVLAALLLTWPLAVPASANPLQSTWSGGIQLAQSGEIGGGGISGEAGRSDWRQRPRPQRYYCVLDSGGSCPASSGRVGERCRCSNQTGNGRLVAN